MAVRRRYHPEARKEYAEAVRYYAERASVRVAEEFVGNIKHAIAAILARPSRWRIVKQPDFRQSDAQRFPYVLIYRWEPTAKLVTIIAVKHTSRAPDYWHVRS